MARNSLSVWALVVTLHNRFHSQLLIPAVNIGSLLHLCPVNAFKSNESDTPKVWKGREA